MREPLVGLNDFFFLEGPRGSKGAIVKMSPYEGESHPIPLGTPFVPPFFVPLNSRSPPPPFDYRGQELLRCMSPRRRSAEAWAPQTQHILVLTKPEPPLALQAALKSVRCDPARCRLLQFQIRSPPRNFRSTFTRFAPFQRSSSSFFLEQSQ